MPLGPKGSGKAGDSDDPGARKPALRRRCAAGRGVPYARGNPRDDTSKSLRGGIPLKVIRSAKRAAASGTQPGERHHA